MTINMGSLDRKLRVFLVAPALVVLGLVLGPGGALAIVLYVMAGVMVLTSTVGFCPLYTALGIKTCPVDSSAGVGN